MYCLDDLSTGNLRNIAHLRDRPNFHLVVDSVLSPSIVNELVHKCDVVYHLAAAVGVRLIVEQPVHTLVTNVQGTHGPESSGDRRVLGLAGPGVAHERTKLRCAHTESLRPGGKDGAAKRGPV